MSRWPKIKNNSDNYISCIDGIYAPIFQEKRIIHFHQKNTTTDDSYPGSACATDQTFKRSIRSYLNIKNINNNYY